MENDFIVSQSTLYCAFVQKLGQSNYGVDSVTSDIINNWDKFDPYFQSIIQKEIQFAIKNDKAGLEMDKYLWNKILALNVKNRKDTD